MLHSYVELMKVPPVDDHYFSIAILLLATKAWCTVPLRIGKRTNIYPRNIGSSVLSTLVCSHISSPLLLLTFPVRTCDNQPNQPGAVLKWCYPQYPSESDHDLHDRVWPGWLGDPPTLRDPSLIWKIPMKSPLSHQYITMKSHWTPLHPM